MMLRWLALCLISFALVLPAHASAQGGGAVPPEQGDETVADENISVSEQVIEVESTVRDAEIEDRIRRVLSATEQFPEIRIEVNDGVAILSGLAKTEQAKDLAATLAGKTKGVAAVVNNIAIDPGPYWNFAPAMDELDSLVRSIAQSIPLLAVGLVFFVVAILLAGGASRVVSRLIFRRSESVMLQGVLQKTIYVVVILVGVYVFLRISGLTRVALTVVSGTGLIGLVLGFAFRDIAENFLASLLLSIQRPFMIGDTIEVSGNTGIVRKVTTRGTLLIDFDGNHIQLSNAEVYKSTIKNFTANPKIRAQFTVGIGYDDGIAHAQQVIRDLLEDHPAVLGDPEPLILVHELGASTVNLVTYFWIDGEAHSLLKVRSSVIRLSARALTAAGITMPDESREVIFPNGVPVRMVEDSDAPASSSGPPAKPSLATGPVTPEAVTTEAEGDLSSEKDELNKQADESRDPDQGANVLADGHESEGGGRG